MSRIAKYPVTVPSGVEVKLTDGTLSIKGPKGRLEYRVHPKVKLAHEGQTINVGVNDETRFADAMSGTTRALVNTPRQRSTTRAWRRRNFVARQTAVFPRALSAMGREGA